MVRREGRRVCALALCVGRFLLPHLRLPQQERLPDIVLAPSRPQINGTAQRAATRTASERSTSPTTRCRSTTCRRGSCTTSRRTRSCGRTTARARRRSWSIRSCVARPPVLPLSFLLERARADLVLLLQAVRAIHHPPTGTSITSLSEVRSHLAALQRRAFVPERIHAHGYEVGDLVIFDNRACVLFLSASHSSLPPSSHLSLLLLPSPPTAADERLLPRSQGLPLGDRLSRPPWNEDDAPGTVRLSSSLLFSPLAECFEALPAPRVRSPRRAERRLTALGPSRLLSSLAASLRRSTRSSSTSTRSTATATTTRATSRSQAVSTRRARASSRPGESAACLIHAPSRRQFHRSFVLPSSFLRLFGDGELRGKSGSPLTDRAAMPAAQFFCSLASLAATAPLQHGGSCYCACPARPQLAASRSSRRRSVRRRRSAHGQPPRSSQALRRAARRVARALQRVARA